MGVETPIVLCGSNLKERHRHLNNMVTHAFETGIPIEDIIKLPEFSPIDRIFKIDLASKYKHVDFVLQNLKGDCMLYVSRCFKCLWLLNPEYKNIINPSYLENSLYPEMILPAKNKMKNWLYLNLKDKQTCEEFYNYYKSNFDYAIKFFWHCSNEFILSEFPHIIDKLKSRQLKIVFEACPEACKLYFEMLPNNNAALTRYINDEQNYFRNIKYLLKSNTNVYLDIVEKYFNKNISKPFNSITTQFILKKCKSRIFAKIELYVSCLLHMKTLADTLNSDEAKQLVLQLARASYLEYWFSYKAVEPLIKRVNVQERAQFKKQVFIDKLIDNKVKEWPYEIPEPLKLEVVEENDLLIDADPQSSFASFRQCNKRKIRKKCAKYACDIVSTGKSPLDLLFNRYRFVGFERTFVELKTKLLTESTIQGRLNIMLVLVSKSGGVPEQLEKLLNFLVKKHINEPTTFRIAVIRSFVNRQCIWRLHDKSWDLLMQFGRGLGLDDMTAEQFCREGLHAVIIRHLLTNTPIPQYLLTAFLNEHSIFTEYKLSKAEKVIIAKNLPPLFIPSNPNAFIKALTEYKMCLDDFPEVKVILVKLAREDTNVLELLFNNRMLRRELFRETFAIGQTEEAYINVLRHDVSPLNFGKLFITLIKEKGRVLYYDKFLRLLLLYFGEAGGLADMHKICLEEQIKSDMTPIFVRPLCILSSDKLILSRILELNSKNISAPSDKLHRRVAAAFRANAQKAYPPLNIDELDWRWLGAKAVANNILICRQKDHQLYLTKLLEWPHAAKISFRLAYGTKYAVDTFLKICSYRPVASLKIALSKFINDKDILPSVWTAVKSIIENIDLSKKPKLLKKMNYPPSIPSSIETDYRIVMFKICRKFDKDLAQHHLNELKPLLPKVDKTFIYEIAIEFIKDLLTPEKCTEKLDNCECEYVFVISKILLLSESEETQKYAIDNVCVPFFDALYSFVKTNGENNITRMYLKGFIFALKFTKAFLSEDYVNPFPVFESILKKLRQIWPTQEYFSKYVEIHLTMLYYKTLKQTLKIDPDIFNDTKKTKECIKIVGALFGKYIGFEIKQLVSTYFESITDLYKVVLKFYLDDYFVFHHRYDNRGLFITFVIKGMLEAKNTEATVLAEYLFINYHYSIEKNFSEEILKILEDSNDIQVKYLLYSDVYPAINTIDV